MREDRNFFAFTKISLPVLIALAVLLFALYLSSSSNTSFSQTVLINTNQKSLVRFFSDDEKTARWWQAFIKTDHDGRINIVQFSHYYLSNAINLKIKIDDDLFNSEMQIIPTGTDSSYIRWKFNLPAGKNAIEKIQRSLQRNSVGRQMQEILFDLEEYAEKSDNIYGSTIEKAMVKDTLLVVTKSILKKYPGMAYVYDQIALLKKHISDQQAAEKNYPMLYVFQTDKGLFETTIAIPVNKEIKTTKAIIMQRMVAGDILWMECKGGPSKISKSFHEIENYMQDYQKSSPALPFELLVTDRLTEPDTSKWITKIYYPVY